MMTCREDDLRDALLELDRLRKQETSRRRESECVMQVLKVLTDESDEEGLPQIMLNCLCRLFELDEAAIVFDPDAPLAAADSHGTTPTLASPETADYCFWPELPAFRKYLEKAPRIIADSTRVPGLQDTRTRHGSFLAGRLGLSDARALLVLYRSPGRTLFNSQDLSLFLRVVPIVDQALKRRQQGEIRSRLELELSDRQKMESLGTLAGGVAHEINTPLQYVTNNLSYLADAADQLLTYAGDLRTALAEAPADAAALSGLKQCADRKWSEMDGDFLTEDLPDALDQSQVGLERISKIVRAIREFSHPAGDSDGEIDINREIENAVTVSENQWKYVAGVDLDLFGDLPFIRGASDHMRQVLINLIVNATHAIEDRKEAGLEAHGKIGISTFVTKRNAVVTVTDNGAGMPESVLARVFDPFFTTKAPGRGTGQGLSLCYTMIVQNLKGRIDMESTPDKGTTVRLTLPLRAEKAFAGQVSHS
ncbi:ATP-binding protein [Roseibium sp. AS2]|uniref:sensor histidine kinase n=1 Tax=Roseibium sp. AS2 TaxID=3135781 RepID=UPI00317199EC